MTSSKKYVTLVPVGFVAPIVSKVIAAHINGYLQLEVTIAPALKQPCYAYNQTRCQYDAASIINVLEAIPLDPASKVIGIADLDLFVPLFTHCLGEARQAGRCAIISIYRLRESKSEASPISPLGLERAAKIALHELGHLFGLVHCDHPKCLMHFSSDPQELDPVTFHFCRYCNQFLQEAMAAWQSRRA